jgi:hypothetical protein
MDDIKKPFRKAEQKVKATRREVDGFEVRDDLESLRHEIRALVGRAADDLRAGVRNVEREAYRRHPN